MGNSRVVRDELMVEVGKAKEGLYVLDFGRGWPGCDAIKLYWAHSKLTGCHDHPEIFDFRDIKLAFFKFQMEVQLGYVLKDTMGLFSMGCWVRGGDEEVIHIDDEPSFSDHVSEGIIYELLECGRRVTQVKEYDCWLKKSFMDNKGSFPLMTVFDSYVVISQTNIRLGEVSSLFQLVYKVGDEEKGICIARSMFIEIVIILARAEFAILLFYKEEERSLG